MGICLQKTCMKIIFSNLAVFKLEKLSKYLVEEFSVNSKNKFIKKLNSRITTLQKNPELYPASLIDQKLRKCVVTKHSSLLYEIHEDHIFILNLIDNRQDIKSIHMEINKHFG